MEFRNLGASGLNVPALGLGTANFRAENNPGNGVGDKLAGRLVDMAIDHGAAFFDTGDIHATSEQALGKALGRRRHHVLIATKAGLRSGPGANEAGASRHHLLAACDESLRRLGTDYVDLFQVHSFDARTPVEETLSTLDGLIAAGKVRYVGCSNYAGWQLMKSLAAADRHGWARFVSHQIACSLVVREAEWELFPLARDQNVAHLAWGPLAGGLLSGRYGRGARAITGFTRRSDALGSIYEAQLLDIIACLGDVAKETGTTPAQVAIAWLMQRPTIATTFVGASSPEQFAATLAAREMQLAGDQLLRLDEVSARPAPYPHGLQHSDGAERAYPAAAVGAAVRVDRGFGSAN